MREALLQFALLSSLTVDTDRPALHSTDETRLGATGLDAHVALDRCSDRSHKVAVLVIVCVIGILE